MDPQVQGAWIAAATGVVGIVGTAIVAIAGFRNTRRATDKTLGARRDDRLWARKADAYQDAMTAALQRHDRRQQVLDAKAPPEAGELQVSQEWFDMQGRLRTFGASKVVTAFEDSMKATERLNIRHENPDAVTKEFKDELHNAMAADVVLVRAIRRDLGIEPVGTKPNAIDLS